MKRLVFAALALALLAGCGTTEYSTDFFAMNTVMRITGRGSSAQETVIAAEKAIHG